jgi:hypothetical protein
MTGRGLGARVIKLERRHPELYEPAGLEELSDLELIRMWQDAEGIPPEQQTNDFQTAAEWLMSDFKDKPFC